jgi:hypothetical protein
MSLWIDCYQWWNNFPDVVKTCSCRYLLVDNGSFSGRMSSSRKRAGKRRRSHVIASEQVKRRIQQGMEPKRTSFRSVPVTLLTLAVLSSAIATPTIYDRVSRLRRPPPECGVSLAGGAISNSSAHDPVQRTSVAGTYNRAPLSFEANNGQADASVKFLTRGVGYELFLTSTQAVLSLQRKTSERTNRNTEKDLRTHGNLQPSAARDVVRMKFIGARSDTRVAGEEVLRGKVNYLLGSDPRAWRTNIATYGKVRYDNIYHGIDLVYHGNQRRLEYDFHVAPGADPDLIRLGFEGVKHIELDSVTGDLVMRLSGGALIRQHKPIMYQEEQGRRRPIAGQFVIRARSQIGFDVGTYIEPYHSSSTPFLSTGRISAAMVRKRLRASPSTARGVCM